MFILFDNGAQVTQFNPLPDYWQGSASEDERKFWQGDVQEVAARTPGVSADTLARYLRPWDTSLEEAGKAFPDDKYCYLDVWQMSDFMKRLAIPYPLGEQGEVLGKTFEFIVPEPWGKG